MRHTSEEIRHQLNNNLQTFDFSSDNEYNLGEAVIIFKRLDKDEILKELA